MCLEHTTLLADKIKELEMTSSGIKVDHRTNDSSLLRKGNRCGAETVGGWEERQALCLQTKESLRISGATDARAESQSHPPSTQRTNPADVLISHFGPLRCEKGNFCCCKPHSLWQFFTAAVRISYKHLIKHLCSLTALLAIFSDTVRNVMSGSEKMV